MEYRGSNDNLSLAVRVLTSHTSNDANLRGSFFARVVNCYVNPEVCMSPFPRKQELKRRPGTFAIASLLL